MKRLILILAGLLPLLIGFLFNHLIMTVWYYDHPAGVLIWLGLGMFVIWFLMGMFSTKAAASGREALMLLNAAPFAAMVLVSIQTIIAGHFWGNIVGLSSQFFFIPFMGIVTEVLTLLRTPIIDLMMISVISFGLLILVSWSGMVFGERGSGRRRSRWYR
ncbi:MAG: hypothetical protein FWE24_00770 [Defluviitaleaceae bacterium]|nr:hypothetical protein [Defluviitaleaceae bacterium]